MDSMRAQLERQADEWYPHFTSKERADYIATQMYIATGEVSASELRQLPAGHSGERQAMERLPDNPARARHGGRGDVRGP